MSAPLYYVFRYPISSLEQAPTMLRTLQRDSSHKNHDHINTVQVARIYGFLRESPGSPCSTWNDHATLVEALRMPNYYSAAQKIESTTPIVRR